MNSNVNIISTDDFNEFISSLNEISNYIADVEQQLNDIKSSITYDPTGEIMAAYESAAASIMSAISNVKESINSLSSYINNSINEYKDTDQAIVDKLMRMQEDLTKSLKELKDTIATSGNVGGTTLNEFMDLVAASDKMFNELYDNIKIKFQGELEVQHQLFMMQTEPELLDQLIESVYAGTSEYKLGTKEFKEGLAEFKKLFTDLVMSNKDNYPHDDSYIENESNIPKEIWNSEKTTEYDKALLLLAYGDQDKLLANIDYASREYYNKGITNDVTNLGKGTVDILKEADRLFSKDLKYASITEVVNEYTDTMITLGANASTDEMLATTFLKKIPIEEDKWLKYLNDNNYLGEIYQNNPEITNEELLEKTLKGHFLAGVYKEY